MMATITMCFTCLMVLTLIGQKTVLASSSVIKETMGSMSQCQKNAQKVHWVSQDRSVIITGRADDSVNLRSCSLRLGLASTLASARLLITFHYIYIHDCSITLQVNESAVSDFSDHTNHEIFVYRCHTQNPGRLYARPKHYLQLKLMKDTSVKYNFYLNVSMAESLPKTGPPLHVVLIVGFVMVILVLTSLYLLVKYLMRVADKNHELQQTEALSRAIDLYNNSLDRSPPGGSAHRQSGTTYVGPPGATVGSVHSIESSGSEVYAEWEPADSSRNFRNTARSDIAFVHSDGRIERFTTEDPRAARKRRTGTQALRGSTTPVRHPAVVKAMVQGDDSLPEASLTPLSRMRDIERRSGNRREAYESDIMCDVPPSYEEALDMPVPGAVGGRDDDVGDEEEVNGAIAEDMEAGVASRVGEGGCLQVDYMNLAPGGGSSSAHNDEEEAESDCTSALLGPQQPMSS